MRIDFRTTFLFELFLFPRKVQLDIRIGVHWSSCKIPLYLSCFKEKRYF